MNVDLRIFTVFQSEDETEHDWTIWIDGKPTFQETFQDPLSIREVKLLAGLLRRVEKDKENNQ